MTPDQSLTTIASVYKLHREIPRRANIALGFDELPTSNDSGELSLIILGTWRSVDRHRKYAQSITEENWLYKGTIIVSLLGSVWCAYHTRAYTFVNVYIHVCNLTSTHTLSSISTSLPKSLFSLSLYYSLFLFLYPDAHTHTHTHTYPLKRTWTYT